MPENQSGYIPGRGTITAWSRIFKVIHKKYIFEFDFQQFFPTVSLRAVKAMLHESKFPEEVARYIFHLAGATPKLQSKDLADETIVRQRQSAELIRLLARKSGDSVGIARDDWEERTPWGFGVFPPEAGGMARYSGVAQGTPLSPLLSILPIGR